MLRVCPLLFLLERLSVNSPEFAMASVWARISAMRASFEEEEREDWRW